VVVLVVVSALVVSALTVSELDVSVLVLVSDETGVVLVVVLAVVVVAESSSASPAWIRPAKARGAPPLKRPQPRFFPCEAALHRPCSRRL
jgi:hypothetical protein